MKKTRVYGLIGETLSHSFSQQYFVKKFQRDKIPDAKYENFPLDSIDGLPDIITGNPLLMGLNVTIPYKKQVISYLESLDEVSGRIGAVNTIKIFRSAQNIHLTGYNTDVYGFRKTLVPSLRAKQDKALVIGTGGASEAVKYVLNELEIEVVFVSRNPSEENEVAYDYLNREIVRDHRIIINTTPVGMYPHINLCPEIDYSGLTKDHLLYDLIYNPETTLFLERGKEAGCTILNGKKMLELQAEKSWEIWNT